jgi:hypothetical protein
MRKILMTSLTEIASFNPCVSGWRDILKGQGKTKADDVPFPLKDCLKSNSFSNVCWLLAKRRKEITILVTTAKLCTDSVSHLKNAASASASASAAAYAAAHVAYAAAAVEYAISGAEDAAHAAYVAETVANYAFDAALDTAVAEEQQEKNKNFLLQAIEEYEETLSISQE